MLISSLNVISWLRRKKLAGDRRDSTPGGHHKGTSIISSTSTADSALIAHLRGSSNYRVC